MSNSRKLADIIESDGDITITGKMQSPGAFISNGVDNNSYNENIRLPYAPNGISVIAFGAGSQSGRPDSASLLGYPDRLEIRNHDGGSSDDWKLRVYAGKVESSQVIEAPIFRASGADVTPAGTTFANTFKGTSNNRTVYFDGNGSSVSTWYGVGNKPYAAIDSDQSENLQFWTNNASGSWTQRLTISDLNTTSSNQLIINYAGGDDNSPLIINTTSSDSFNHSIQCINPNLTANECNLILLGTAKNTKNAGYLSFRHSASGSNDNALTMGFWNNDHLFRLRADGNTQLSGGISVGNGADYIDQFDVGNWTPTLPNGGTVAAIYYARYQKIGRHVYADCYINISGVPNNNDGFRIGGLPFPIPSNRYGGGTWGYSASANVNDIMGPIATSNFMYFHKNSGTSTVMRNSDVVAKGLVQILVSVNYIDDN